MRTTTACLALLGLAACAVRGAATTARPAPGPDAPSPRRYEVPGPPPALLREAVWHVEKYQEIHRLEIQERMPPALRGLSHASDPTEILLWLPRPLGAAPRPLVLMSPVLANSTLLMNEFASSFTRRGWVAAVVMRKEFDFDPNTALDQAEGELRAYVVQSRQALDYLVTRPEVDPRRIATFGVSAGATISATLAGVDPRPVAHVFVLAGGPLADVLAESKEDRFVRYRAAVREALRLSDADLRERLRRRIVTDPVLLAPRVPRDEVLMFVAMRDTSIPTGYQLRLWEALGRPRRVTLPFGHKTSFVLLPGIAEASGRFLAGRFAAVEPTRK